MSTDSYSARPPRDPCSRPSVKAQQPWTSTPDTNFTPLPFDPLPAIARKPTMEKHTSQRATTGPKNKNPPKNPKTTPNLADTSGGDTNSASSISASPTMLDFSKWRFPEVRTWLPEKLDPDSQDYIDLFDIVWPTGKVLLIFKKPEEL